MQSYLRSIYDAIRNQHKPAPPVVIVPSRVFLNLPPETMEILIDKMTGPSAHGDGTYWILNGYIDHPGGRMIQVHILR